MLRQTGGGGQVIEPQEKEEWKMKRDRETPRRPQRVLKIWGQNLDDNCVSMQVEGRVNAHSQMGVFLYQCNTNFLIMDMFALNQGDIVVNRQTPICASGAAKASVSCPKIL